MQDYVKSEGDKHIFTYKFPPSIQSLATLDYTIKIILPEGATDISYKVPYNVNISNNSTRFTYLDTPFTGRPVITMNIQNVMDDFDDTFQVKD